MRDGAQHRRGAVGRRTDVLNEVIEHLGDAGVMHSPSHRSGDRRPHAQAQHIRERGGGEVAPEIDGIAQALDRLPEEEALRHFVQTLRDLEEGRIALGDATAWCERLEFRPHSTDIFPEVERGAVREEAAPLRIEADELELVLEPPVRFAEDACEDARHGQDRRPHVEPKTTLFEHRRFAAEPLVFLEQDDFMAARGEGAGSREPTEAAADDADGQVLCHHEALAS